MAPKKSSKPAMIDRELGDGDWKNVRPTIGGRPKRKRCSPADSPFVDSAIAVSDPDESDSSDGDEDDVITVTHRKRRALSPQTPSAPSPPLEAKFEQSDSKSDSSLDATEDLEPSPRAAPFARTAPTRGDHAEPGPSYPAYSFTISNLVVSVPPGHVGPILLQLEIPQSSQAQPAASRAPPAVSRAQRAASRAQTEPSRLVSPLPPQPRPAMHRRDTTSGSQGQSRAGFLDLPPELRNDIYERVFVADKPLHFRYPNNFQLSASFLRTCKQVYEEGRSLLYMENKFVLERRTARSGSYWQPEWNEAGFKPVRCFLKMIGPPNIALLRHVGVYCEDAMPCLNPDMHTADDRRFTNDEILMSCLRHLSRHAKLQTLELNFNGRRRLARLEARFLDHLTAIRTDQISFVSAGSLPYISPSKHSPLVEDLCRKHMVRKRKLYQA